MVKFKRFGELIPSFGKSKEEYILRLEEKRQFSSEEARESFRGMVEDQWLDHRPPEGVRGVYAFLDGIVVGSILPVNTKKEHVFEAPSFVWAKFGPDGQDLEIGEWYKYNSADEVLDAVMARGDAFISQLIVEREEMAKRVPAMAIKVKNFWPWDLVSDYGLEFFVEM